MPREWYTAFAGKSHRPPGTGRNIDFMISTRSGSGLLIFRRRNFSLAGRSIMSLEEANWRQWLWTYIPLHGKMFAACEERWVSLRVNSEEILKYFQTIALQGKCLWTYAGIFLCIGIFSYLCSRFKISLRFWECVDSRLCFYIYSDAKSLKWRTSIYPTKRMSNSVSVEIVSRMT